eukprot:COSAG01_NODE_56_length_31088_cov_39.354771_5_plen_1355_part_00
MIGAWNIYGPGDINSTMGMVLYRGIGGTYPPATFTRVGGEPPTPTLHWVARHDTFEQHRSICKLANASQLDPCCTCGGGNVTYVPAVRAPQRKTASIRLRKKVTGTHLSCRVKKCQALWPAKTCCTMSGVPDAINTTLGMPRPQTWKYEGEWKDGKQHGYGLMTYDSTKWWRQVYEGEWKDGRRHGTGSENFADGTRYVGEWKDGRRHGNGTEQLSDGTSYRGEWKHGHRHGKGTEMLLYESSYGSSYYKGQWKDGHRHGKGSEIFFDGSRFEGQWKDSRRHGNGSEIFSDGKVRYKGEWKDGQRHGHGTETLSNGIRYEGDWKDGRRHGHGTETLSNGIRYEGDWKDGRRHGNGTQTLSDGSHYEGEWKDGLVWHGHGTARLLDVWHKSGTVVLAERYEGEWKNGRMQGHGTAIFRDLARYEGEWKDGHRHGHGTETLSNGIRYEGDWKDGQRHGHGTETLSNGIRYEGDWKDGRRHGNGTQTLSDGSRYGGEWKDGRRHGHGTETLSNGIRYEGDWKDGRRHGNGTQTLSDGSRYEVEWKDGLVWHGHGTETLADNSHYEGEWKDGRRHGYGTETLADKSHYEGEWKDGRRHGNGTETLADKSHYEGEWKDGSRHGNGTQTLADKSHYEGEWKDGRRHGHGTETLSDGSHYEGEWKDGRRHGHGTETLSPTLSVSPIFSDGTSYSLNSRYEGKWKDGSKVGGTWSHLYFGLFWLSTENVRIAHLTIILVTLTLFLILLVRGISRARHKQSTRSARVKSVATDINSVVHLVVERLSSNSDELQHTDEGPQATFMDFAGQRMYYLMHHIFISSELSIYLVVFSLDEAAEAPLSDEGSIVSSGDGITNLDNIHFWLNSIHAQAPRAPIMVIGTKSDLVDADVRKRRISDIETSFEGAAFERQLLRHDGDVVIAVDNTRGDDPGVDFLQRTLAEEAGNLSGYGDEIPLGWLKFLDLANERAIRGTYHISLATARALARECKINTADDRELLLMMHLHTCFGFLMHFDEPVVRDLVVLKPQWLLDLMAALLCQRRIKEKLKAASKSAPEWRRLANEGRLDVKLLPEIWPELESHTRHELLGYLNKFGFCCKLPREEGIFLVPPLLSMCTDDVWRPSALDASIWLRFIHNDGEWDVGRGFLPQSLFFNLEVLLLQFAKDSMKAMKTIYQDCLCFFGDLCFVLRHSIDVCCLELTVRADTVNAQSDVARRVCKCLDSGLAKRYGVRYRLEIECTASGCHGRVPVDEEARCSVCHSSHQSNVSRWLEHPQDDTISLSIAIPEESQMAAPVRVLQPNFAQVPMPQRQYDFFINHAQASGQDQASKLRMLLEHAGASVWYDMGATDLTARGMEDAVHGMIIY